MLADLPKKKKTFGSMSRLFTNAPLQPLEILPVLKSQLTTALYFSVFPI